MILLLKFLQKKGPLAFLPISNNKTSIVYSINNSNLKIMKKKRFN